MQAMTWTPQCGVAGWNECTWLNMLLNLPSLERIFLFLDRFSATRLLVVQGGGEKEKSREPPCRRGCAPVWSAVVRGAQVVNNVGLDSAGATGEAGLASLSEGTVSR